MNSHLYSYSYDENDNMTGILYQIFENGNDLQNFDKYFYAYNDDDLNSVLLYQIWENEDWQNSYQYLYYYDEDGNMINSDYQTWQRGWMDDSYVSYFYDENGNLNQLLWQYWFEENLYDYSREFFSYEDFISIDEYEIPIMEVRNYPNPFRSETTIYFNVTQTSPFVTLDIFNLKGQKIKSLECNNCDIAASTRLMHSITWSGKNDSGKQVSPGIYLLKIKTGNYQTIKKMLRSN